MTRLDIAEIIENISNVKDQRALVNDSIQSGLEKVYQSYDWPYYMQEGAIRTVADYTTGTAAVTQDSATVTITTGVVATGMVGRKFRASGEKPYYRILSVNTGANTLTLEQAYQGSDNATATYVIYKDEYRLAPDVDKYKMMRQIQNGVPMWSLTPSKFDERFPTPQSYADPLYEMMVGTKLDTYSTGTLSGSGTTLTGSAACLWTSVEGLGRMSLITIGTEVYTVKSVDSATQLTIYENAGTIAALTTYSITLNNIVVQLYQIPSNNRLIYYRYFRIPVPLHNDYDIPDMPAPFHDLLIQGGLVYLWQQKGDTNNHLISSQEFDKGIQEMKLKIGSFAPDRTIVRGSCDSLRRRRFDGLETSNFDRRYSM